MPSSPQLTPQMRNPKTPGRNDSMCACVAHFDHSSETVVIDAVREITPPFSPEAATEEICRLLRRDYGLTSCMGDRWGGEWPIEQFLRFGIDYEVCTTPKSSLYVDFLDSALLIDKSPMVVNTPRRTTP
jgi:hypothetical protein